MLLHLTKMTLPYIRVSNAMRHSAGRQLIITANQRYSTAGNEEKDVVPTQKAVETGQSAPRKTAHQEKYGLLNPYRVTKLDKYVLVWSKKYKSMDEIPERVSRDTMERARNVARIKFSLIMIAATLGGCLLMIWSGKKAHREGQSVAKMNQQWHREIKEAALKEAALKEAALAEKDKSPAEGTA